jgi:hypothetical protein|tara:strand:+ start:1264 stop:1425 length:162 start_codon:yes stop_codon:yes gene_type:complete
MKYLTDRILEPSTWAGLAVALLGVSVFFDMTWLMVVAAVAALGALVLREQAKL